MKKTRFLKIVLALNLAFSTTFPSCAFQKSIKSGIITEQIEKQLTLEEKAEYFESDLEKQISEEGLCLYKLYKNPETSNYEVRYSALADSSYLTGCLLGAEALRYKVTYEEEKEDAKEKLEKLVNGLHILQQVTGRKGYIARVFCKKQEAFLENWPERKAKKWFNGTDSYSKYLWKGDTSKDQYTAVLFGYSLAFDAIKDEPEMQETRNRIKEDVTNIADFLIENNFQIIGERGRTKFGDLSPKIPNIPFIGLPIGLNALHCLTWLKIAYQVTGQEKYKEAYDKLVEKGYHKIAVKGFYDRPWPFKNVDYVNNNMAFLDFYNILRLEENPEILKNYRKALRKRWQDLREEENPFWNFVYAYYCNEEKERAIKEGVKTLKRFPLIPSHSFDFRLEETQEKKYTGTAFLFAYWLACNQNFIPKN